jgi:hypothetical protein
LDVSVEIVESGLVQHADERRKGVWF